MTSGCVDIDESVYLRTSDQKVTTWGMGESGINTIDSTSLSGIKYMFPSHTPNPMRVCVRVNTGHLYFEAHAKIHMLALLMSSSYDLPLGHVFMALIVQHEQGITVW